MLEQIPFTSSFLNWNWNILMLTLNLKWNWKIFNRSEDSMHFCLFYAQNLPSNDIKLSNQVSGCPRHVKVRNLENGSSFLDTLHLTAKEVKYGNMNRDFSLILKYAECNIGFLTFYCFSGYQLPDQSLPRVTHDPKGPGERYQRWAGSTTGSFTSGNRLPQAILQFI